jgi:NADPH2:quinone reductase
MAGTSSALVITNLSGDFSGCELREIARPTAGHGQIVIEVTAAALNFPDILMTRGEYQLKPPLPFVLGMEAAGAVVEVGAGVDSFQLGDGVVAVTRVGAFAQHVVVEASVAQHRPRRLTAEQACAFGVAYTTAYVGLVERARLRRGEWVLILGAGGGVGLAATDLAIALGARVIAGAGSAAKLAVIAERYGPEVTLRTDCRFRQPVLDATGMAGADIVYDPVGGPGFRESLGCIAFNGRLVIVGFASGEIPDIPAGLPLIKGCSLLGLRAGEYGRRFPDRAHAVTTELTRLAETGALNPHIHATLPLRAWRDAFQMMVDRSVIGKIVLRPWD